MTPILLLVDLQRDYLQAAGLTPAAGDIVENAAALLEGCRAAQVPALHVWTTITREVDRRMPHWRRAGKWSCVEGEPGHQPPLRLMPMATEPVVHKQFFSAFSSNALAGLIAEWKATTLIIAGVHLHACVRQTALDAYAQGFEVWVAEDAVGSDDPLHAAITRRYLESRAAQFAPVEEILRRVRQANPKSEVAPIVEHSSAGITSATRDARAAWPSWCGTEAKHRGAMLERLAILVEQKVAAWAERMAAEIGKPIVYGRTEVARSADLVRSIARQPATETNPGLRIARRRALGVVAVITPWNNPVLIPMGKVAAALFYGNAVVWKPAPAAEPIADEIVSCLRQAGCPDGLVRIVRGGSREAAALMSDPGVDAVTLTGGMQAGYCAQEICGRRHIPLQSELGGNNAAIVWRDADLNLAARSIADGAFGQAGQRCTANRRAIVHESCYAAFLELLTRETARLPLGDPLDVATRIGPMISARESRRVAALLGRAAQAGQILSPHEGHAIHGDPERFHSPTIVCCDDPTHEIVQEETFGPVLVVQRAANWIEAMQLCNGVRQGLAAAVFTTCHETQDRFLDQAQAGILKINQSTADADVTLPFGGWKASGVGPPEHGIADREFYSRHQAVYRDV